MRATAIAAVLAIVVAGCAGPGGGSGGYPRSHGRGHRGDADRDSAGQRDDSTRYAPDPLHMMTEELRIDLKLTPEQEPLWQDLVRRVDAMRGDAARERVRLLHPQAETAPQQIDHSVDVARDRLTATEDAAAAARALYAKLSDEQKKVADTRLARLLQVQ